MLSFLIKYCYRYHFFEKYCSRTLTNDQSFYGQNDDNDIGDDNDEGEKIDAEFIPEVPVDEGNVGDYILISFDGYCILPEERIEDKEIIAHLTANDNGSDSTSTSISTTQINKSTEHVPFIQERDWLITLGNGDVLPGLEMAVRFLKLNQCGIVKCHSKFAYGPYGRCAVAGKGTRTSTSTHNKGSMNTLSPPLRVPAIPPNTDVIYKVKIKSILSQNDMKTKSNTFQIKLFQQMKNIGNHYYKYDWINNDSDADDKKNNANKNDNMNGGHGKIKALKLYNDISKDGISLLEHLEHGSDERRQVFFIVVDSLNNIAAVHLREKDYRKAKDAAARAIELDPYNLKALCRAAKATLMIGEFEECKMALSAAEEIVDNVDVSEGYTKKDVTRLKRELIQKKREHKKLEKEIYIQMLSGKKGKNDAKTKTLTQKKEKVNKAQKSDPSEDGEAISMSKGQQNVLPSPIGITLFLVPVIAILIWFWQNIWKK